MEEPEYSKYGKWVDKTPNHKSMHDGMADFAWRLATYLKSCLQKVLSESVAVAGEAGETTKIDVLYTRQYTRSAFVRPRQNLHA